jgi:hypothetical protein
MLRDGICRHALAQQIAGRFAFHRQQQIRQPVRDEASDFFRHGAAAAPEPRLHMCHGEQRCGRDQRRRHRDVVVRLRMDQTPVETAAIAKGSHDR